MIYCILLMYSIIQNKVKTYPKILTLYPFLCVLLYLDRLPLFKVIFPEVHFVLYL